MPASHAAVVLLLVALLAVLHVIQWAVTRAATPAGRFPPLRQALRDLAGGRDPWTRGLLITAIVAVSFAAAAPLLPTLADLVDRVVPG
ncbi:MAG: hypothetical protein ABR583_03695 [Gaiellaceae bacterium]